MAVAAAASSLAVDALLAPSWSRLIMAAQRPIISPPKPAPAETQNPAQQEANSPDANAAKRAILLRNEKEFRQGVERLYQLTADLRDEVQKTMTTDVLSLRMVKKTEEIEKLAKALKTKAKGG
jgi:hypothetical protein